MKQPRKLTRNEKIMLSKKRLKPDNWMVQSEDSESIVLVHKTTKNTKELKKTV